jgi:hypothetical protein
MYLNSEEIDFKGPKLSTDKLQICISFRSIVVCAAIIFVSLVAASPVWAQPVQKKDTTVVLLADLNTQLECTQALADLYNFKFPEAEYQFKYLKARYKWHPLPYFLMGLIQWWKIMPNTQNNEYDDVFLAYMDSTINVAEDLIDDYPAYETEAEFFLAAAYGFKGRLYSDEDRKNWRKAASAGEDALDYLNLNNHENALSPEFLFGDALYNYFSVWVPENYKALKPLLWFFPKGDKALGLKQLKQVSYNAFYTRTEAMVWLMRILNAYENDQPQAFEISQYLHQSYPDNPYFHRYYARIDSAHVGYEATSGRYAAFFLGQIYEARRKYDDAKISYQKCISFAEKIGATDSGYYLFSLIALGEIAQREGNKAEAKRYFNLVKDKADRGDEAFKDAKRRLKNLERKAD